MRWHDVDVEIKVHAPGSDRVVVVVDDVDVDLDGHGEEWTGVVADGAHYALRAFGPAYLSARERLINEAHGGVSGSFRSPERLPEQRESARA